MVTCEPPDRVQGRASLPAKDWHPNHLAMPPRSCHQKFIFKNSSRLKLQRTKLSRFYETQSKVVVLVFRLCWLNVSADTDWSRQLGSWSAVSPEWEVHRERRRRQNAASVGR